VAGGTGKGGAEEKEVEARRAEAARERGRKRVDRGSGRRREEKER